jgi:general secretion pathway protein A
VKASDPFGVSRGYEQYFGLIESPFSLTPNPRFLFESESHSAAIEQVTLALRRREALVVITGEVGTGKTMLCRTLLQTLEPRTFISVITNPLLTAEDLLRQVLEDFGLLSREAARTSDASQHELVKTLQQFLASLVPLRAHAVILIDEAQHLQPEVLEQVRLLSNFETDSQKLLQIVLVGQSDLEVVLERPELRQLAQRISRRHQLQPLKRYEVAQYVERRLWVAHGGLGLAKGGAAALAGTDGFWRVRFTPAAMHALATLSQGLPRSINVICDRALELAFAQRRKVIDTGCVLSAAKHLKLPVPLGLRLRSTARLGAAAAAVLVAVVGWLGLRSPQPVTPLPTDVPPRAAAPAASSMAAVPPAAPAPPAVPIADSNPTVEPASPAPLPEADGFLVVAGSFQSIEGARTFVATLHDRELPAFVRASPGGLQAVMVGPFASRQEATAAQGQMTRVAPDSYIVSSTQATGASSHGLRAVATTGDKGQP